MRLSIQPIFVLLLTIAAASATPVNAQAPVQSAAASEKPLRSELAIDYSYLHSNAPPGDCGCFSLNGGSVTFAWGVKPGGFALVGDVNAAHAGNISASSDSLTLSAYTVGVRYLAPFAHSSWQPFGQVLAGVAHSDGTLMQAQQGASPRGSTSFAANVGGGVDLRASRRFSVRLIEADYLLTAFNNGLNNHQNNLRIGAGAVVRFGK